MAENEVLDVGSRRQYRRWRKALADPNLTPSEVAEILGEDFSVALRSKLRRGPLYLVLKACGTNREALQKAVEKLKDRAMAKLVEQAFTMTASRDPVVVATQMANLLVDGLLDRANCYALKHDHNADAARYAALEAEASIRLEAAKPQIISALVTSLRNEPVKGVRRASKPRPAPGAVSNRSLLPPERRPGGASHA